ncbi:hypothetical protein GCM10009828_005090 [Actinoplanes couchii]|uniref:Uncharacterized protein n=1 Tax=Actinoplanes couchii TaxID=403638 RepID=A0ABQ3XID4_9ACTN|nr:hypothetical protein Aco03nite_066460 [Actinoplanes couchii]
MSALSVRGSRRPETWSPMQTFRRLVRQRRLRDYDDLVSEVKGLPAPGLMRLAGHPIEGSRDAEW